MKCNLHHLTSSSRYSKRCISWLNVSKVKSFEHKKCFFCGSKQVKKDSRQNHQQRYKCRQCGKRFSSKKCLNPQELWTLYSSGKQSMQELAQRFSCNRKTIARHLKQARLREPEQRHFSSVNIIMDTTYFGRKFGVMVLYDSISRQALSVSEVRSESNALYRQAIRELQEKGI